MDTPAETNAPQAASLADPGISGKTAEGPGFPDVAQLTTRIDELERRVLSLLGMQETLNKSIAAWELERDKIEQRTSADSAQVAALKGNISQLEEAKGKVDSLEGQLMALAQKTGELDAMLDRVEKMAKGAQDDHYAAALSQGGGQGFS